MIKPLLIICLVFSGNVYAEIFPIHIFHSKNGQEIGKLYLEYTKNNLIKSAKIKHNSKTLYTIDRNGFSNENEIQMKCNCTPFYGFTIGNLSAREISVLISDKAGREVSDTAIIRWHPKNKVFTYVFIP